MTEDIKELIEKIQQEGVKAAEDKARAIESDARRQAEVILAEAKKEAQKIIAGVKEESARMLEAGNTALKQAGRDLLLSLRKEINAMLDRLIAMRLGEALSTQELVKIITAMAKDYKGKDRDNIVISLNKDDLEKLEKGLLVELKEEIKKGITLRPSEDILAGFIISFDGGKSYFDFTDKALAEYLGSYIKPRLQEILKGVGFSDAKA